MILTTKSFKENIKAEYSQQVFFSHQEPCNLIIQTSLNILFHYHIISSVTQNLFHSLLLFQVCKVRQQWCWAIGVFL